MAVNPVVFREYDIRGVAGTDLTEETVELVARSARRWAAGEARWWWGRDVRLSGRPSTGPLWPGCAPPAAT
jgi:phosphomannomutase